MGSFSIMHWLIVLVVVVGIPGLVIYVVTRKRS